MDPHRLKRDMVDKLDAKYQTFMYWGISLSLARLLEPIRDRVYVELYEPLRVQLEEETS